MNMDPIDAIACDFAIILRGWATAEQWQTMREANSRYAAAGDHGICASHDFCDANEAMAQAFENIIGREPKVLSDDDNDIWNAAWDRAKSQFLTLR